MQILQKCHDPLVLGTDMVVVLQFAVSAGTDGARWVPRDRVGVTGRVPEVGTVVVGVLVSSAGRVGGGVTVGASDEVPVVVRVRGNGAPVVGGTEVGGVRVAKGFVVDGGCRAVQGSGVVGSVHVALGFVVGGGSRAVS